MTDQLEEQSDRAQYIGEWAEQCVCRHYAEERRDAKWLVMRRGDQFDRHVDVVAMDVDIQGMVNRKVLIQVKGSLVKPFAVVSFTQLSAYVEYALTLRPPESFWFAFVSLPQRGGMLYNLNHMKARIEGITRLASTFGQNPNRHPVTFSPDMATSRWELSTDELLKGNLIDGGTFAARQSTLPMDMGIPEDKTSE